MEYVGFFFLGHFLKGKIMTSKQSGRTKTQLKKHGISQPSPKQEFKVMNSSSSLNLLEMKTKAINCS